MSTSTPLEAIFFAALQIGSRKERDAYLDEACAGNPDLRDRVEKMLVAQGRAGSFLEVPAAEHGKTIDQTLREGPGDTIGPYRLLEQIGEGGMGTVFMAEQLAPVHRKVALKVIKAGMDTRQVIARFDAERQALALMDHQHIAKVYDAGMTASGLPYFVMELVRGIPITQFCDEHQLTIRERLELFVTVCHAAQHAHQKGIIHRDIKPSNVMVTMHDDRPVVKVIDFGVAKATSGQLTDMSLFTGFMQMVGTPMYMSPEQTALSGADVDTRSDIYSLGVLLYELLTGTTPFDRRRLDAAALDEVWRIIREEEPNKPSTRLSAVRDTLASVAAQRHIEPKKLSQLLRGDLDWIVMKALEKDRTRRYETANGMARDVQRYLADEVVEAGPPSATYRFRKAIRRNKVAISTAGLVSLALITGTTVSIWQAYRATEQATRANEAEQRSEANFRKARQAVDDMYTQVAERWLAQQPQLEPVQREFLEKALRFYDDFAKQSSSDPDVRFEAARARRRVADIQHRLGQRQQSEQAFNQAIDQLQTLADEFPNTPVYQQELAEALHKLGVNLGDNDRRPDEEQAHRRALVYQEQLAVEFPGNSAYRRDLGRGYCYLGLSLGSLRRDSEAESAFRSSLTIQKSLVAEFPSVPEYRQHLADSHLGLGESLRRMGRPEEGLREKREGLDILEQLVSEFPAIPEYRNELAHGYYWLADGFPTQNAEKLLRQALILQEKLAIDFPAVSDYQYDLLRSIENLAHRLGINDRAADAEQLLRRGVDIGEKLVAMSPNTAYFRRKNARVHWQLAEVLRITGQLSEAESVSRKTISIYEAIIADFSEGIAESSLVIDSKLALVPLLGATGRPQEASETLDQIVAECKRDLAADPDNQALRSGFAVHFNNQAWSVVSETQATTSQAHWAVALAKQAVELAPEAGYIWNTLGVAQYRTGDWKAAIASLKKSMELYSGGNVFNCYFLSMAHWQLGERDLARTLYEVARLWSAKYQSQNQELLAFRAEAATLLGLPETEPNEKADEIALGESLVAAVPQAWTYRFRGEAFIDAEQWDRAANDFSQAISLGDQNFESWYQLALLRRATDDAPGYKSACADMLNRFVPTEDSVAANFAAWSCALGPDALTDYTPAIALAQMAAGREHKSAQFAGTFGAILYRAGRFDEARLKLDEADRLSSMNKVSSSPGYVWFFLAMTHHCLGHTDESHRWLTKAQQDTDTALQAHDAATARLPWNRRLTLNLLRREAEELISLKQTLSHPAATNPANGATAVENQTP